MINNLTVINEPFCWPKDSYLSPFGPVFSIVSFLPYVSPIFDFRSNIDVKSHENYQKMFSDMKTIEHIYHAMLVYAAVLMSHILQSIIGSSRPVVECVPSFLSANAIPDPGLVSIFCSAMISIGTGRNDIKQISILSIKIIIYLFVYNTAGLATFAQIFMTAIFSLIYVVFYIIIRYLSK